MPMNKFVAVPDHGMRFPPDTEVVSPELALVDPSLAEWARERLPNPLEQAALARISSQLVDAAPTPSRARTRVSASRVRRRRRWVGTIAAAAAGLAAILLLTDVQLEIGKTPASADTTAIEESPEAPAPPVVTRPPTASPRNARPRAPLAAEPQRFAWAPSPGATSYQVELFRASEKVFAADTTVPAITIPASWTFAGRRRTLAPGDYRWYVWPVASGSRAAHATVQAKLTVPGP